MWGLHKPYFFVIIELSNERSYKMAKKKRRLPDPYERKEHTIIQKAVEKVKMTFASEEEEYQYYLKKYRDNFLPEEYNQLELLDRLTDTSIDHLMSITTRGDGKSFNYISCLGYLAYNLNMPTLLIVRHWTLQDKMRDLVEEIIRTTGWGDIQGIQWETNTDYMICYLDGRELFLITDLNRASDLKQSSAVLKRFPIILYDEFLTLTDDYVDNEFQKMGTIYKSIDRVKNRPYIKFPKCIYLGNPVNFTSPLLPALNIYNYLQSHEINTMKQYNNVLLEMRKNEARNDGKNLRAFPDPNDGDVTGEFKFASYQLSTPEQYISQLHHGELVKVRIDSQLMFTILKNNGTIVVGIERADNEEDYCLNMNDEELHKPYLTQRFFKDNFHKRYEKGKFLYKDAFSKEYITNINSTLMDINFYRLFKHIENVEPEEVLQKAEENRILNILARKYE